MDSKQNNLQGNDTEKLKEIPKWTRKYAQNRTLTVFVLIAMICFMGGFIAFPVSFGIAAFMGGNMLVTGICVAFLASILVLLVVFVLKFGGKNKGLIDQIIDRRIYGKEGVASMPMPKLTKKRKWLDAVSGIIIFICIIGSNHLHMEGYISAKYLLPVSAIFIVPFFIFQYFMLRPRLGPLLLIGPMLYAIHAILILAGLPIFFTGNLGFLNMLPIFGYTFVACVIAHFYGRYALKKLKGIAHLEGDVANGV